MKKTLLAILSFAFYFSASAQCSVLEIPLSQRANAASLVVEGKVISKNSFWNSNNTMIYTSNVVEVYKVFKGSLSVSTIQVLTEGGTVGLSMITVEPSLELNVNDIGIFTCEPVTHARSLQANISAIPRFEPYSSVQGFVKYDLNSQTASDPFHSYTNIENDVYPVVLEPSRRNYTEVIPFNIHSSLHNGPNPTVQVISGFNPTTITAGTGSQLTITGTGFGATQGSGTVGFKNGDDGGATYINPLPSQYISWSNTQIVVEVPDNAGTGTIQVTQGVTQTSAGTLTVSYAQLNVQFDPGSGTEAYETDHVNDNGSGGYTWRMNTAFDADVAMRASFMRAFDTWRCATGVNWQIGTTTSVNDAISDGINVICEDGAAPLSPGILGVCYSYWSGCASGPTIIWYVNELDIIFDDGSNITPLTWEYGTALPSGSEYDFETVAVHELGHGHQLGHVINNGAIMHYAISNGTSNRALGVNDLAGGNYVQAKSVVANICGPGAMTAYSCAAAPVADFSGTPTTLCQGGTVAFTDLSTNTPTSWSWVFQGGTPSTSTAQNPSIVYNTAGTYSVTLTATNGSGSDGQSYAGYITVNAPPNATALSQTNISCNGGSNGAASVTVSGGTPSYSYNWTPGNPTGDGTASVTGLTTGTWTCTVTDANSCTDTQTFNITQPTAISLTANSQTNISCNGGSNGAASVNAASGGTPSYTYNWTPGNPTGDGTVSVTGLAAGTWTCTVTDANSCTTTRTFSITQPTALAVTPSQTNVSCNGGANGSATVSVSGGTPSYTYLWTPTGGTTATEGSLFAGSYTCTITDANGCQTTQTFTITQPPVLNATRVTVNVTCFGGSDGSGTVNPTGGTAPYTYVWTPLGGTAATSTPLVAGAYVCTITDANGCSIPKNFLITQPPPVTSTPTSQVDVTCNGGNDGSATVVAGGGIAPYTYAWTPSGGTAATASSLTAGNYTCTITDANSCTLAQTFTITEPGAIGISMSHTDENCSSTDGTATATPSGGNSPYTYLWAPGGQTTQMATNLSAGTYTCTVTDAIGCSNTGTVTVANLACGNPPLAGFSATPTSVCAGGSVAFTDFSTESPTSWAWTFVGGTPSSSTAQNPTIVYNTPGTYDVTLIATNASGSGSQTVNGYITVNANPSASGSVTNITCSGGNDGAIDLTPSGGTAPYTFLWNPSGQTTEDRSLLTANTYSVTVTDANGCIFQTSFPVSAPGGMSSSNSQTNVSCFGGANGSATVSVSGGTPGYTYLWTPTGGTSATAGSLFGGSYTCTITDLGGCQLTETFAITQPAVLNATRVTVNVTCFGGSDGSGTVNPTGGTAPYTYVWTPLGGTAATSTPLVAGAYVCTITDANGCSIPKNFLITQPPPITSTPTSQTDLTCNGSNDGAASVVAGGGVSPYTYAWTPSGGTAASASSLAAGSYTCTITDANSCTLAQTFTITQPTAIGVSLSRTQPTCANNDGTATVVASGGAGGYTYLWMPGAQTASTATGLAGATYTCTVTDANGCSNSGTITLTAATCGNTQLTAGSCGVTLTALNQNIYCVSVPGATNYQYKFMQGATTITTYTRGNYLTNCDLSTIPVLRYAQTYQVQVRSFVGSTWGNYGVSCNVTTPAFPAGQVAPGSCGTTLATFTTPIYCNTVIGATNYEWRFMQGATLIATYQRGNWLTDCNLTNVAGIQYGQTYDVTVRAREGGDWGPFGTSCTITTPPMPTTQVSSTWCNGSVTNLSSGITCNAVPGATNYQWRVQAGAYSNTMSRGNNQTNWRLSWNPGTTVNTTYNVSVRALVGGVWGAFGTVCTVAVGPNMLPMYPGDDITPPEVRMANPDMAVASPLTLDVYPNPFSENITITTASEVKNVSIYNSFGELVRTVDIENGTAELKLGDLSAGIYLIQAQTSTGTVTKRVIKN